MSEEYEPTGRLVNVFTGEEVKPGDPIMQQYWTLRKLSAGYITKE